MAACGVEAKAASLRRVSKREHSSIVTVPSASHSTLYTKIKALHFEIKIGPKQPRESRHHSNKRTKAHAHLRSRVSRRSCVSCCNYHLPKNIFKEPFDRHFVHHWNEGDRALAQLKSATRPYRCNFAIDFRDWHSCHWTVWDEVCRECLRQRSGSCKYVNYEV